MATCVAASSAAPLPRDHAQVAAAAVTANKEKEKTSNATASNASTAATASTSSSSSKSSRNHISVPIPDKSGTMHSFMVNTCKFLVDVKFSPLKPLGRGAYGVVCSALDKVANRKVAIKKVVNAFDDLIDAKRILREIKMLRHFRHENVIGLRDLIPPPEEEPFNDIYIVLDFMETDLHKIIYSKNELTDEHIQYFIYQILKGMKYIHSANVIHRDLKPSNLLLNSNCDLKICDFGLARGVKEEVDYELTEYVVTRWYRAPEVMCSCHKYDHKIDVWSIGCIMAELHGRKPLFPGDDYIKQMNLIFNVLGTPSSEDLAFITNEKALEYIKSLKKKPKIPFNKIYKDANPLALDLLDRMLTFNPHKRISIDEALAHPYLKSLHNPKTEAKCSRIFNFEFEKEKFTRSTLQDAMYREYKIFRPQLKDRTFGKESYTGNIKRK